MRRFVTESLRIVLYLAYFIGILSLFVSLIMQKDEIGMLESLEPISIHGTVSIDGGPLQVIEKSVWQNGIKHSLVVYGHFNHEIKDGESLILWPRNLRVKIYVNGTLKISTGQRESFPQFIQYAGNSYQIFYIGNVSTIDEIRIEIEKAYTSCRINVITNFFNSLFTGREGALYQSIMSNEMLQPLIGLALTFIGILVLSLGVLGNFSPFPYMSQIYYLGCFCIVGGISYVCDSSYAFIDLLFPHPVYNTLVDLCCIPLLLFFYLKFITNSLQSNEAKCFMKWITKIFATLELIPILLQILGKRDLHEMQDNYIITGGIIVLLGCGSIIYEIICKKNKEMKKVLIAASPLMFSLLLKIINVILERGVERAYLRIGILISCLLLLYNTIKYVERSVQLLEQENQIKQELQNTHIAIMLSQIQPHFLYNALNTLQHICKKDGALAAEAIDHFSRYLRGNMDSLTDDRPIPFERELEHVKHYLYIEKLRFGDRVHVEYDLEITAFYVPTLTLQPIIENAIRHGITKQVEGGVVKISTKLLQDEIWIIVTDNGIGFDLFDQDLDKRNHIGIDNVRKRLQLQCNGTLDIISKKGIGTQVTIRMKGTGFNRNESYDRR